MLATSVPPLFGARPDLRFAEGVAEPPRLPPHSLGPPPCQCPRACADRGSESNQGGTRFGRFGLRRARLRRST
eukprot:12743724-Alexandrium_andersonii.AAC.1